MFFLTITYQRAGILLKEEIFVVNIPLAKVLRFLLNRLQADSRLGNFGNLSLINSGE